MRRTVNTKKGYTQSHDSCDGLPLVHFFISLSSLMEYFPQYSQKLLIFFLATDGYTQAQS